MTLDLDVIKQRAEAASAPPWSWQRSRAVPGELLCLRATTGAVVSGWSDIGGAEGVSVGDADRAFIAHARADVPDLVAEVERLRSWFTTILEWSEWLNDTSRAGPEHAVGVGVMREYCELALQGRPAIPPGTPAVG